MRIFAAIAATLGFLFRAAPAFSADAAGVVRERVVQFDLIEFNSVLNDEGRVQLRQTIAWRFDEERSRFVVEWYQVWTGPKPPSPWRSNGFWRMAAGDVVIESRTLVETTTWHDPELADRDRHPCERRAGLPKSFP